MTRLFFVICTVLLLASCAQVKPSPESFTGPVANINDTNRKISAIKMNFYEVAEIDGRNIYSSSACTSEGGEHEQVGLSVCSLRHPTPAGKQLLHIRAVNYATVPFFTLFNNIYKVEGDVVVTLEAGKEYFVKGEISKGYAAVWVEDSKGSLVSRKIEK